MANIPVKVQTRLISGIKKFQKVLKAAKTRDINESDTVTITFDNMKRLGFRAAYLYADKNA